MVTEYVNVFPHIAISEADWNFDWRSHDNNFDQYDHDQQHHQSRSNQRWSGRGQDYRGGANQRSWRDGNFTDDQHRRHQGDQVIKYTVFNDNTLL